MSMRRDLGWKEVRGLGVVWSMKGSGMVRSVRFGFVSGVEPIVVWPGLYGWWVLVGRRGDKKGWEKRYTPRNIVDFQTRCMRYFQMVKEKIAEDQKVMHI